MEERTIHHPPPPRRPTTPFSARITVTLAPLAAGAPLWSVASEFEHCGLSHVLAADIADLPDQQRQIVMWSHQMPTARTLKQIGALAWVTSVVPERLDPGHPEMVAAHRRAAQYMAAEMVETMQRTVTEVLDDAERSIVIAREAFGLTSRSQPALSVIDGGAQEDDSCGPF